jgi:hypothetical protein
MRLLVIYDLSKEHILYTHTHTRKPKVFRSFCEHWLSYVLLVSSFFNKSIAHIKFAIRGVKD